MVKGDSEKLDRILSLLEEIREGRVASATAWMSPEGAAQHLDISVRRVYEYVRAGSIPFHRLPGSNLLRFHADELDAWVRSDADRSRELSQELIRRLKT